MTESEGEIIRRAIGQIRELHRNVSLLIKTAEAALLEEGWVNIQSGSYGLHEFSYSIDRPEQWMTWEVFRYYKHNDYQTKVVSVAVLLDDADGRLAEPIVTTAMFEFDFPEKVGYENWYAALFKAVPDHEADGKIYAVSRQDLPPSWQSDFDRARCFAWPLVSINSETDLRQNVVQRLQKMVLGK